ncbi:MAG: AmmeMemoRadiSam system protein A [Candidatus Zixiibacteriota bacterium]|nr:MAG: AmmeMemoRadiSam system protein A [candidate division Zixibacteria bacterium]
MRLTKQEGEQLLAVAREAVRHKLLCGPAPSFATENERLKCRRGAFVTITSHGDLRGCIGYIEGVEPLIEIIHDCAIQAGFHDGRFEPLSPDEYPNIAFEISVLTPLIQVEDLSEVVVGKHGLLISSRGRSGLLLPQVATEQGWDRDTFLAHTCLKAGLPWDEWKNPRAEVYRFEAQIFSEKK